MNANTQQIDLKEVSDIVLSRLTAYEKTNGGWIACDCPLCNKSSEDATRCNYTINDKGLIWLNCFSCGGKAGAIELGKHFGIIDDFTTFANHSTPYQWGDKSKSYAPQNSHIDSPISDDDTISHSSLLAAARAIRKDGIGREKEASEWLKNVRGINIPYTWLITPSFSNIVLAYVDIVKVDGVYKTQKSDIPYLYTIWGNNDNGEFTPHAIQKYDDKGDKRFLGKVSNCTPFIISTVDLSLPLTDIDIVFCEGVFDGLAYADILSKVRRGLRIPHAIANKTAIICLGSVSYFKGIDSIGGYFIYNLLSRLTSNTNITFALDIDKGETKAGQRAMIERIKSYFVNDTKIKENAIRQGVHLGIFPSDTISEYLEYIGSESTVKDYNDLLREIDNGTISLNNAFHYLNAPLSPISDESINGIIRGLWHSIKRGISVTDIPLFYTPAFTVVNDSLSTNEDDRENDIPKDSTPLTSKKEITNISTPLFAIFGDIVDTPKKKRVIGAYA